MIKTVVLQEALRQAWPEYRVVVSLPFDADSFFIVFYKGNFGVDLEVPAVSFNDVDSKIEVNLIRMIGLILSLKYERNFGERRR